MPKQRSIRVGQQRPTTVGDAYAAFILARQAAGVTQRTLDYYADKLYPFILHCEQDKTATVEQVTAATVRTYLLTMQRRNLAPYTVHGAARAIRAFLRFCAGDGYIPSAPEFAMPKLPKTVLPAFEPADVARLLDVCEAERDRLIVLMLLDTGLRAAELCAMDSGDIDTNTGAVLVRMGKGQKQRTVFLGAKTRRELARYWRKTSRPVANHPVWTSQNTGARLTDSGLRQLLQRLGERASVEHCHPHTFRRTFALWSLRGGMDIHTLAALMGHADIGVLRQYLALTGRDLQRAHAAAGPVDHMTIR